MPPFFVLTPAAPASGGDDVRELWADWVGEADVGNEAFTEEGGDASARAVEELIGDDEVERAMFFLERSDSAKRDDAFNAEGFHAVNVGTEVQL